MDDGTTQNCINFQNGPQRADPSKNGPKTDHKDWLIKNGPGSGRVGPQSQRTGPDRAQKFGPVAISSSERRRASLAYGVRYGHYKNNANIAKQTNQPTSDPTEFIKAVWTFFEKVNPPARKNSCETKNVKIFAGSVVLEDNNIFNQARLCYITGNSIRGAGNAR